MKDITKEKLIKIGFIEKVETAQTPPYYYYEYVINDNCLLISDASDENDGNFTIEFFDFNGIRITAFGYLNDLIVILKRNTI